VLDASIVREDGCGYGAAGEVSSPAVQARTDLG
jgi:hypothetical protein